MTAGVLTGVLAGELQDRIQTLLQRLVSEGAEQGVQAAAYVGGEPVVNAWAGVADSRTERPVDDRTLFPVFSTTKGIAATVLHLLAERGQISYDAPIADLWPEFAAHGKERVTVRQALSHSAGIPQVPRSLGLEEIGDWEAACRAVADLEPLWKPGTRIQYHAITYGWIVGEVVRRAAGRPFSRILEDEIVRPLGIDGQMYVGIPDHSAPEVLARVAYLEEPDAITPADDGGPQAIPARLGPLHEWMNREDARRACLPASSGLMSAAAIARHYAALLPGGVDGRELLPPSRVRLATEQQKPDNPESEDYPRDWGLGYQIGGPDSLLDDLAAFGHGGYGGSIGFADPALGLAVGFTRNRFSPNDSPRRIVTELRAALAERLP